MKPLFILLLSALTICLFTNSSCKKNNPPANATCGCASTDIKYSLINTTATLSYFQYKAKWVLSYHPVPGNTSNYFPCNTTQDSLQKILQGANQNQVFQVKFSGKVKAVCPDEEFGFVSGVTTFDYIVIDSLKRY